MHVQRKLGSRTKVLSSSCLTVETIETGPDKLVIVCDFVDDGAQAADAVVDNLRSNGQSQRKHFIKILRDYFVCEGEGGRTVIPCLMMSFIRSSSMVLRKFSLGSSIKGTTSSRILATLQIIMKSFCVCRVNTQTHAGRQFKKKDK